MKQVKSRGFALVATGLLAIGLLGSGAAFARGDHGWGGPRVGVWIGGPVWWGPGPYAYPYGYPYGYRYYDDYPVHQPIIVEVPAASQASSGQPPGQYWYYCRESQMYYPHVKDCPSGWQAVAPQPAPPAVQPR
jgi:hypothetical protein